MSSPRALPPKAVLDKLQEEAPAGGKTMSCRKRCYSESARHRSSATRRSTMVEAKTENNNALAVEDGISLVRKLSLSRRKASRQFCLDNSIARSTEQLGRICQELSVVNQDLTHVVDVKRKLSDGYSNSCGSSNSSTTSDAFSSECPDDDDLVFGGDLFELCRCAQQDLRMADLARQECRTILSELEKAWHFEEKDMCTRASWLRRESAQFEKVSAEALEKRLQGHNSDPEENGEEGEDDDDFESALRRYLGCSHNYPGGSWVSRHYSVPLTKRDRDAAKQASKNLNQVIAATTNLCVSL